jgi:DNA polymerase-3 subunit epsilon
MGSAETVVALDALGETGRVLVADTETTGFSSKTDRIVEIGIVELVDLMPTGREFHAYVNPDRDVPEAASKVHGLTRAFLADKPRFAELADRILGFIGDDLLVAHNANFDIGFINAELARLRRPPLRNPFVDTVAFAKRRFPGAKATLDDLCRKFGIDMSSRNDGHGALVDSRLLARVYLELHGGRQRSVSLGGVSAAAIPVARAVRAPRPLGLPSPEELVRHSAFLGGVKDAIWTATGP